MNNFRPVEQDNVRVKKLNGLEARVTALEAGGTSGVVSVNGKTGPAVTLAKVDLGLGNVDNTSDANKPISSAVATALAGKQPTGAYLTAINSTLVTNALGFTPYNAANPSGYISAITSGMVTAALGFTPQPAGAYLTSISSALVTAALGYTPTSVTGLTGTQSVATFKAGLSLTKSDVGLGSVDNTADSAKAVLTATKLATPRTINGVAFDGSANITINAVDVTARLAASAVSAFGLTLIDDPDAATARSTLGLGTLATQSGTFSGSSSGTNTGDQTTITGNAGTATALQTARNINGVAFDGTTSITINAVDSTARLAASAVSAFMLTVLDDADAATARATLGAQVAGSYLTLSGGTITGTLTVSSTIFTGGNLDLTSATNVSLMWQAGVNGRILMVAGGATYRHPAKHSFRDNAGTTVWTDISPSGLNVVTGTLSQGGTSVSLVGHTHAWADIVSGKPTTIAGYGITDLAASGGSALVGYIHAGTGAVARTVQAKLRESVSPKDYGAVGDGATNDLTAVSNALAYAFANGLPVDGGNSVYAISGSLTVTSQITPWIKALRLKQLSPSNSRRSLYFNLCTGIRIDSLETDLGTSKTLGYFNDSAGLWIEGGSNHSVWNVTAFGHGKNSLIVVMSTSQSTYGNLTARDAEFDDAAATDDVMQGIYLLYNTDCVFYNPRVSNLTGNALYSGVAFANLRTRGVVLGGNLRCDLVNPRVRDVDQGIDVTGGDGNRQINIIGGHAYQCTSAGLKFANSAYQCKATSFIAERCGTHGYLISGPAAAGLAYKTSFIDLIGCTAIDIGYNNFPSGSEVGFGVEGNAFDTSYPKGVRIVGCRAIDTQTITLTAARVAGATSGTLTVAWAMPTRTQFARFDNGETRTVTLTNGSTAVTWTGGLVAGAGVTLAIPTMQYGYYSNITYDADKRANELIDFISEGHTVARALGDHRPYCRVTGTGTQSLTNGVEASILFASEIEDTMQMHSTASNTDRIVVPIAGTYRAIAKVTFNTAANGYRRVKVLKNGANVAYSAAAPVTGEVTVVALDELIACAAGDYLTLGAEQTSGGAVTLSLSACWFEAELVKAA